MPDTNRIFDSVRDMKNSFCEHCENQNTDECNDCEITEYMADLSAQCRAAVEKETSKKNKYANYIGRKVQLFPGDTNVKYGIIRDVNDLGWIIEIIEESGRAPITYKAGNIVFYSHSFAVTFKFI